ncbi:BTB/POZ domain-containing protein At3g56230-like [Coffea arabica]|uniref:BTB/POZ domain-containing protein At3g56230-like n=1 Tax=Coffea arabica TaxID=13443 RepID=A0A6P6WJJ9_COFAR|nr:BTB/POZ domain-containing protein At3g56230-like [Coffea arabica]XP_027115613.1 BTB/POZ domain-containing protein At3g56230-like [Coffea arabica]
MDCPVCNCMSSPILVRPLKYTICGSCFEGARSVMALMNKLDHNAGANKSAANKVPLPNPSKGFANALRWVKEMKETEDELRDRLSYLAGFVSAFKDQIHTDIQVKPGGGGPCIPAHRALLAARSTIFRNMLDFDGCMAPSQDIVKLPELNYEELEAFLEFLYSGNLPREKIEQHVYSLSVAADKYEVPFLQKFCEQHMLRTLNSSNALDVLEISDTCSSQSLKEATLRFIVQSMEDIVFSSKFDAFALKNPHLSVQITRTSCIDSKTRRNGI